MNSSNNNNNIASNSSATVNPVNAGPQRRRRAVSARGPNWSTKEKEALCKAWIRASNCSVVGSDQDGDDFGVKVKKEYDLEWVNNLKKTPPHERGPGQCLTRFGTISLKVSKFCGKVAAVNNRNQSGSDVSTKVCLLNTL